MPTGTKPRPAFPLGSTFTTQSAFIGRCETGRRWRSSTTAPPHWLALAVDMWTTQARCPQTHSSRRSLWRHDKKEKERTRFPTRNHPPLVLMTGSTSVFFVGGVEMPLWEQIKHHLAGHVTTYIVTLATGLVLLFMGWVWGHAKSDIQAEIFQQLKQSLETVDPARDP